MVKFKFLTVMMCCHGSYGSETSPIQDLSEICHTLVRLFLNSLSKLPVYNVLVDNFHNDCPKLLIHFSSSS